MPANCEIKARNVVGARWEATVATTLSPKRERNARGIVQIKRGEGAALRLWCWRLARCVVPLTSTRLSRD